MSDGTNQINDPVEKHRANKMIYVEKIMFHVLHREVVRNRLQKNMKWWNGNPVNFQLFLIKIININKLKIIFDCVKGIE